MTQKTFMEKYPIWTLEVDWNETECANINEVCNYFMNKVEEHPKAAQIGLFDHYDHTSNLPDGEIAPDIKAAKIVVFCFGPKIPTPEVLAVRPRGIGITDLGDKFVVSFLEAPAPNINEIMEGWALSIKNASCSGGECA